MSSKRPTVRLDFGPLHYALRDSGTAGGGREAQKNVGERKQILRGITGVAQPGQVLAVIGPSGGGKTTLLNALAGRIRGADATGAPLLRGPVALNGRPRQAADSGAMKRLTGYVMQDDLLLSNLTVHETLFFTAMLRMPGTRAQKEAAVEDTIAALRLTGCQHSVIGAAGGPRRGISGGERKRVNIGNELLADPSLLLLDEPTSGLDSHTALALVRVLADLAAGKGHSRKRTVVVTLHQPSSQVYAAIDRVMLLAAGRTIFFGAAAGAPAHFAALGKPPRPHFNPADHMLDVVSEDPASTEALADAFAKQQLLTMALPPDAAAAAAVAVVPAGSLERALENGGSAGDDDGGLGVVVEAEKWTSSWLQQFLVLAQRSNKNQRGETIGYLNLINVGVITAVVSGLWWRRAASPSVGAVGDVTGYLFFTSVFWGFWPMFNSLSTFPAERAVMFRERASGSYRLSAYFVAKSLADVPLYIFMPLLYAIVTYPMVGLGWGDSGATFVCFCLTLLANSLCAQSMGIMVSCVVLDFKKAMVVAGCTMLAFMLCGGFYLDPRNIPPLLKWVPALSFTSYTFPALMLLVHKGAGDGASLGLEYACRTDTAAHAAVDAAKYGSSCPVSGQAVLDEQGIEGSAGTRCLVILLMLVIYRLIAYACLRFLHKPSHK